MRQNKFGETIGDWLSGPFEQHIAAVLVTVAKLDGSGPRDAGAKMLFTSDAQFGSIGGGHLELRAGEIAREMLGQNNANPPRPVRSLQRFALAAGLGQCCGGVVHILFEVLDQDYRELFICLRRRSLARQDSWRVVPLGVGGPGVAASVMLLDASGKNLCGDARVPECATALPGRLSCDTDWLIDPCLAHRHHLVLFGAGHVGAALVRAMADLPCYISWVDEREGVFPARIPGNVSVHGGDDGEAAETLIKNAAAGSSFLVMTHSHARDLHLAEAILRRECLGWFGMIGSQTKRMQFEHRLRERGIAAQRLRDMVCPIGLPGIVGKEPAVIAASVCAQLLQWWGGDGGTDSPRAQDHSERYYNIKIG